MFNFQLSETCLEIRHSGVMCKFLTFNFLKHVSEIQHSGKVFNFWLSNIQYKSRNSNCQALHAPLCPVVSLLLLCLSGVCGWVRLCQGINWSELHCHIREIQRSGAMFNFSLSKAHLWNSAFGEDVWMFNFQLSETCLEIQHSGMVFNFWLSNIQYKSRNSNCQALHAPLIFSNLYMRYLHFNVIDTYETLKVQQYM